MNNKVSLCPNCLYRGDCIIEARATAPIYYCEEHFIEAQRLVEIPSPQSNIIKPIPLEVRNIVSLCDDCLHRFECVYRAKSESVYNCEYYQ